VAIVKWRCTASFFKYVIWKTRSPSFEGVSLPPLVGHSETLPDPNPWPGICVVTAVPRGGSPEQSLDVVVSLGQDVLAQQLVESGGAG